LQIADGEEWFHKEVNLMARRNRGNGDFSAGQVLKGLEQAAAACAKHPTTRRMRDLTRKARNGGLTDDEKKEQQRLRNRLIRT